MNMDADLCVATWNSQIFVSQFNHISCHGTVCLNLEVSCINAVDVCEIVNFEFLTKMYF